MDLPKIIGPARLSDFPEHAILIAEIIGGWSSLEDKLAEFLLLFASPDPRHTHLIMANVLSGKTKFGNDSYSRHVRIENDAAAFKGTLYPFQSSSSAS